MNGTKIALTFNSKFFKCPVDISMKAYPQNNAIDKLIIKTDTNASEGSFFMTGFDGFRKVTYDKWRFLSVNLTPPLDKRKVLMSLKVDHHRSTKLLIKDNNAKIKFTIPKKRVCAKGDRLH